MFFLEMFKNKAKWNSENSSIGFIKNVEEHPALDDKRQISSREEENEIYAKSRASSRAEWFLIPLLIFHINNIFYFIYFILDKGDSKEAHRSQIDIRQKLEEILKLMLTIWCKENNAVKLLRAKSNGSYLENLEYGFLHIYFLLLRISLFLLLSPGTACLRENFNI